MASEPAVIAAFFRARAPQAAKVGFETATGITSASFVYTTAMQSADFGVAQTELTFRVYQISAQVGRGFASVDTTVDTS